MTRFVKVSLSVVALLLVAFMMFTGCAKEALTAAEEAAQAVVDATKELEEAIDKKADADELAAKVEALSAAIESANALVTDGDETLKKALEEAKETVFANAETLISTYNVQITTLLDAKADKKAITEKLDALEDLVDQIHKITGASINISEFTELSTAAAYYAYRLEVLWEDNIKPLGKVSEGGIYADADFEELRKAYKTAEVVIYRATSGVLNDSEKKGVIEQAYANFEAAVKETPNAVDTLYYNDILPYINNTKKDVKSAYDLYVKTQTMYDAAETLPKVKELMTKYYAGFFSLDTTKDAKTQNLLVTTIELWRAELKADVDELGARYLVYVDNDTYKDVADMATARNYIDLFNGKYDGDILLTPGAVSKVGVSAFDVPSAFLSNEARAKVLTEGAYLNTGKNGAKAAAEYLNAETIKFFYGDTEGATLEGAEDKIAELAVPTPESVNAVNRLKKLADQWATTYAPALGANPSSANQTRYAANKAAVDEATAIINKTYSYLYDGKIAEYKAEAAEFIAVAEKFFENGHFDELKVQFHDGDSIEAAVLKANAWATKWNYTNLDVYDATVEVTAVKAYGAVLRAKEIYPSANATAIQAWKDLETKITTVAGWDTADKVDMYAKQDVLDILAWYTTYGFAENGVVSDKVNDIVIEGYEDKQMPTTEYFAELTELVDTIDELYAAKTAAKNALQAKINAIDTYDLTTYLDGVAFDYDNNPTVSGVIAALEQEIADYKAVTVNGFVYASAPADHTLNEADVATAKTIFAGLVADAAELAEDAATIKAMTSSNDRTAIETAKNTLNNDIEAFVEANADVDDAAFTTVAYAAVKYAEHIMEEIDLKAAADELDAKVTALENANLALKNANDVLAAVPAPYFADDIARDAHTALVTAVATAKTNLKNAAEAYAAAVSDYTLKYNAYKPYDNALADLDVTVLPGYEDYNTNKGAADAVAVDETAEANVYVAKYNIVVTKLNPIKATAEADANCTGDIAGVVTTQYAEAVAKVGALADVNNDGAIADIVSIYKQSIQAVYALEGFVSPV